MKYKTYLSALNNTKHIFQLNRKCQTTISDTNGLTYTFTFDSVNTSERPEYNTIDVNETNLEKKIYNQTFKHYQKYDFHKLTQEEDSNKVSVLYTC